MSTTSTRHGLAEVIPLRPDQESAPRTGDRDSERLAELETEIWEAWHKLDSLVREKSDLEMGGAA